MNQVLLQCRKIIVEKEESDFYLHFLATPACLSKFFLLQGCLNSEKMGKENLFFLEGGMFCFSTLKVFTQDQSGLYMYKDTSLWKGKKHCGKKEEMLVTTCSLVLD